MANKLKLVETTLLIAGVKKDFLNFELNQSFNNHHTCEVRLQFGQLDTQWMGNPEAVIKYIGEELSLTMAHDWIEYPNVFLGIITNIVFEGQHGSENTIVVYAKSPTIKMDGKPTMDSFIDSTLNGIINEAVKNSGNGAKVSVNAEYKRPIDYICQYKESAFSFLNRMSALYKEWFYYDGSVIHFGKPEEKEPIFISYASEMTYYKLEANLLPSQFKQYSYLVDDAEEWTKETRAEVPDTTGYLKVALDRSDQFFGTKSYYPLYTQVSDSDSVMKMVDVERKQTAAEMLVLKGATQTSKIKIGETIFIQFPNNWNLATSAGYFIITQVTHKMDGTNKYNNSFTAVPASLGCIPIPDILAPMAVSERATVLSNADPDGRGWVQVQFQWQKKMVGKNTNWLRVQTPDAGSSDKVSSNRGFVFIPEIGDDVMIGFEHGDPSLPYVQGSIFVSKVGGGGGQSNKTKSLTTRSGSTVTLDDSTGSVTVKDPSGNVILLDGGGNITITAPNTITMNATDIKLNAKKTITMDAAEDSITATAKTSISATAATEDIKLTASAKDITLTAEVNILLEGKNKATLKKDAANKITIADLVDIDGSQVQIN